MRSDPPKFKVKHLKSLTWISGKEEICVFPVSLQEKSRASMQSDVSVQPIREQPASAKESLMFLHVHTFRVLLHNSAEGAACSLPRVDSEVPQISNPFASQQADVSGQCRRQRGGLSQ